MSDNTPLSVSEEKEISESYEKGKVVLNEEPLYVMTVELEKGKSENIKIFRDSNPDKLAFEFCKIHNLDFSSLTYLTSQIKKLFENIPQGVQSILHNNTQSNECIIEEDEEDNQTNDQRMSSQKENSIDNSNERPQMKKESDSNAIPWKRDTSKLFSYNEFYNRLRQSLIDKSNKECVYSKTAPSKGFYSNKQGNYSKSIFSKRSACSHMTIAKNEEMIIDFFNKCTPLDDIYQNTFTHSSIYNKLKETAKTTNEQPSYNNSIKNNTYLSNSSVNTSDNNKQRSLIKNAKQMNIFSSPGIRHCKEKNDLNQISILRKELSSKKDNNTITQSQLHKKVSMFCSKAKTSRNEKKNQKKVLYRNNHANTIHECSSLEKRNGMYNKKKEMFRRIFQLMKGDAMKIKRIPNIIYKIIQPIVNYKIQEEEFIKEGMKLYEMLSINEKKVLLQYSI